MYNDQSQEIILTFFCLYKSVFFFIQRSQEVILIHVQLFYICQFILQLKHSARNVARTETGDRNRNSITVHWHRPLTSCSNRIPDACIQQNGDRSIPPSVLPYRWFTRIPLYLRPHCFIHTRDYILQSVYQHVNFVCTYTYLEFVNIYYLRKMKNSYLVITFL